MLKENSIVDFVGNVICGAKKANGLRSSGGTLTVKNNLIIDNAWMGIKLGDTPSFGSITNNVIMGNNSGITSYNNDSVVNIANNVITGCRSCGVYMYSKSDLTVKDNIFQGNNRALALRSTLEGQNTNTVLLNTLWENEINFIMWDGADTFGNYGPEPEVFWEAPGFVDPENGYFAVSNPVLIDNEQGLTDPEVFTVLWMRWQNRADVNEPFGIR